MDHYKLYDSYHQHPVNRLTHLVGIPLILFSPLLLWIGWPWALAAFSLGWALQFIGHAFEGKAPAFLASPLYLWVGVVWWWQKVFALPNKNLPKG